MYYETDLRIIKEAEYIIKYKSTVRGAAKVFGVSKSTVHHDVTAKLRFIDEYLYSEVKKTLFVNLSERHIRGGMATREKYASKEL